MEAKIDQKSKLFDTFVPKRFQDAPRRPQDASKTPPGRLLIFITFLDAFLDRFWLRFHPNLNPKINQKRSKIDAEMASHVDLIFGSIFDRFLHPT